MKKKNHKEPYLFLYKELGLKPKNILYYKEALTHSSCALKSKDGDFINNERLEFLGDAILNAVVTDILYTHYQAEKEGFLSNARSKLVQRDTLNKIALEIVLDKQMFIPQKNNIQKENIYGNALEALVGAIYLDLGYDKCKKIIEKKLLSKNINIEKTIKKEVNFKSKLIEFSQKNKISLKFNSYELKEENKIKRFRTEIILNQKYVSIGLGTSKKESQQQAAKSAINKIKKGKLKDILQV